jgi:hypothetical protein
MMIKKIAFNKLARSLMLTSLLLAPLSAFAEASNQSAAEASGKPREVVNIEGAIFNRSAVFKDQRLRLVGAGLREKFFLDLYAVGLYTPEGKKPNLSEENSALALRIEILSSAVTAKRMTSATLDGFEQSTQGNIASIENEIQQLILAFRDEIKPGDLFDLIYTPGAGVEVLKNGERKTARIVKEGFKQALFGIWLSEHAVQEDLRGALLALDP